LNPTGMDLQPTPPEQEEPTAELWEVRDSGTLRALHTYFVLAGPEGELTILDSEGWQPSPALSEVLGAAGFVGDRFRRVPHVVERHPRTVSYQPIRGFRFPASQLQKIEGALRTALGGAMGGFLEIVLGAVGFHTNPLVFATVWEAARRPPVLVCGPDLKDAAGGERGIRAYSDGESHILTDLLHAADPVTLAAMRGGAE